MTITYCKAEDVSKFLQIDEWTSATKPTKETVEDMIEEAQDEIDLLTNTSWRGATETNKFYEFSDKKFRFGAGRRINLMNVKIKTIDSDSGDKIEVWEGDGYNDWVSTKTEGRDEDYWIDYEAGVLYINKWFYIYGEKPIRLSYRHGNTTVPNDIKKCTKLMVAEQLITNEDFSMVLVDGEVSNVGYGQRIEIWKKDIDRILTRRQEIRPLG